MAVGNIKERNAGELALNHFDLVRARYRPGSVPDAILGGQIHHRLFQDFPGDKCVKGFRGAIGQKNRTGPGHSRFQCGELDHLPCPDG